MEENLDLCLHFVLYSMYVLVVRFISRILTFTPPYHLGEGDRYARHDDKTYVMMTKSRIEEAPYMTNIAFIYGYDILCSGPKFYTGTDAVLYSFNDCSSHNSDSFPLHLLLTLFRKIIIMQIFASLLRSCALLALSTGSLGQSVPASALEVSVRVV